SNMVFALYDEDAGQFKTTLRLLDGVPQIERSTRQANHGLMRKLAERRAPIRTATYVATCASEGVEPYAETLPFPYWLGVPMVAGERVVGGIVLRSATHAFTETDERLLLAIASYTALAARSAALYRDSIE